MRPSSAVERQSAHIAALAQSVGREGVEILTVVQKLKHRGFSALILIFALPNVIIPGLSFLLGLPVLFCAVQMAAGREQLWLPAWLNRKRLDQRTFQTGMRYLEKFLRWVEKWARVRARFLFSRPSERVIGAFIAVATLFLMTPVPFGNALPALGISFMAIALIERDGVALLAGIILNILGAAYICAALLIGLRTLNSLGEYLLSQAQR